MERSEVRSFDGSGNHLAHPERGAAGTRLRRSSEAAYADGHSSLAERAGPNTNARHVSNLLCGQPTSRPSRAGLSDFVWAWGQFLDHELDLTEPENSPGLEEVENIVVEPNDVVLEKGGIVPFSRSIFDRTTGTGADNPRQQINQISAFVDATNVYGANETRAAALRRFDGSGKLKTSASAHGDLLPFNLAGFANAGGTRTDFFVAGDIRANEHVVLASMHTLFVREHNRLCDEILGRRPELFGHDEDVYQRARRIVIGLMQQITYGEFLPALLGEGALPAYGGYDSSVDPSIDNLFSTACYRLGHSMLSPTVRIGADRRLPLRDLFFRPAWCVHNGIDVALDGLWRQAMQEIDGQSVDDIRHFLFDDPDPGAGLVRDLAALNIQRGRDHGLPGLNDCRRAYGLVAHASFADVTSDEGLQARLAATYDSPEEIDPWIGGLLEEHVEGASVGSLVRTVLIDQFQRVRDGDRFWFEVDPGLSAGRREEIRRTRLSDVLVRNTALRQVPDDLFRVPAEEEAVCELVPLPRRARGDEREPARVSTRRERFRAYR